MKRLLSLALIFICLPSFGAVTNYFVSFANGSDTNNGLGPDASHASNKPWKTLQKALGTNMGSGDTVYVSPGIQRELITARVQYTANTFVKGDPLNAQGFKDGSGVLVPPQQVRITSYTNDTTISPTTSTITVNGMDYIWFENLFVETGLGSGSAVLANTATSTNLTFTNCVLFAAGTGNALNISAGFGVPLNLNVINCALYAMSGGAAVVITGISGTGSDWSFNSSFKNCFVLSGQSGISYSKSGSSANVAGGITMTNCTVICSLYGLSVVSSSTNNFTNFVTSCVFFTPQTGLRADVASQVVENFNYNFAAIPYAGGISPGANTVTNNASAHLELGQSKLFGLGIRPMFSPNFDSTFVGSANNYTAIDLYSTARPSTNAIGAMQFYNPPGFSFTSGGP